MSLTRAKAGMITYKNDGTGAVVRTLKDKLGESVSVKDFGAVGDGVTDDTAAIQAAIDSGAGRVFIPSGTYIVTASIQLNDGDKLIGEGSARFDNGGFSTTGATVLKRTGANTGAVVIMGQNTLTGAMPKGMAVESIHIDSNSIATHGIIAYCMQGSVVYDVSEKSATTAGMAFTTSDTVVGDGSSQHNLIQQVRVYQYGSTNGIVCTGSTVGGGNFSLNHLSNIDIYHQSGDGFVFGNSDGNFLHGLRTYNVGYSAYGLSFNGSAVANQHARHNIVTSFQGQPNGAIARSTTVPSYRNMITNYSSGNGVSAPVIEGTASLQVYKDNGSLEVCDTSLVTPKITRKASSGNISLEAFHALNSSSSDTRYAYILSKINDATASSEDGQITINTKVNGSESDKLQIADAVKANKLGIIGFGSFIHMGVGSPEGVLVANVGSLYLNVTGGASTTLYVKESGGGNTGWVAK